VTVGHRKQHSEAFNSLYPAPDVVRVNKLRRMRWVARIARMGKMRNSYDILIGKAEGKRPVGRGMRMSENNIKRDITEVGFLGVVWIYVAQCGRLAG
jgi:hypothetical protein